jgi:predicted MFS family arabinose efflux permease
MYYIPLFLESVKVFSPTRAGVDMIPISCTLLPVSVIVGGLISRFGRFRWAIWTGWVVTITATGLLILLDAKTHTAAWVIIFLVIGFGHGLLLMSLNICTQVFADPGDNAHAAGMYTFFRITGNCIGVSIGGTVFQNYLAKHLGKLDLPVAVAKDAEAFVTKLRHFPPGSERAAYIHAFELTFKNVFEVLVGIAALAGIISLFIGHASMTRPRGPDDMVKNSGSSEKENV